LSRIQLTDTTQSAVEKMMDGNPGAMTVLLEIIKQTPIIDPDDVMKGMGAILDLDTHKIYGPRIWMLFKDVCGESIEKMLASLKACQSGLMPFASLDHAIDNMGYGWDVEEALTLVQEKFPNFAKGETEERKDYTTQEILDFCKENNINKIPIHNCSMCGYECGYVLHGEEILYDTGCDCTGRYIVEKRNFDALDHALQTSHTARKRIFPA